MGSFEHAILIFIIAILIDLILGEPPNFIHPVHRLGKVVNWALKLTPKGKIKQFIYGLVISIFLPTTFAILTFYLLKLMQNNIYIFSLMSIIILKFTFSLKGLFKAVINVKKCINSNGYRGASDCIKQLVSRDTKSLNKPQMISATIESLAENINDSILAPWFFFLIFGIPGAVFYRVVNTLDAMIGYHNKYEYLGKASARLDDILNFLPARISGFLIVMGSIFGLSPRRAINTMFRDRQKTESPNAGWPMAAMAGALQVQLEKQNCYVLGTKVKNLDEDTLPKAIFLAKVVCFLSFYLILFLLWGGKIIYHIYA